jgi:restriction system protein
MAIPDFESMMLPLLRFAGDNKEHSVLEPIEFLAQLLKLTDDEKREPLPSGKEPRFDNRVRWGLFYLKRAGLLESTKRGYIKITPRGFEVLKEKIGRANV